MRLTEAESKRRREIVADTIGTAAVDGVETGETMRQIMNRWAYGELTMAQMSAEIESHVQALAADFKARQDAGEILPPSEGNYIPYEGELEEVIFPNGARRWLPIGSGDKK